SIVDMLNLCDTAFDVKRADESCSVKVNVYCRRAGIVYDPIRRLVVLPIEDREECLVPAYYENADLGVGPCAWYIRVGHAESVNGCIVKLHHADYLQCDVVFGASDISKSILDVVTRLVGSGELRV